MVNNPWYHGKCTSISYEGIFFYLLYDVIFSLWCMMHMNQTCWYTKCLIALGTVWQSYLKKNLKLSIHRSPFLSSRVAFHVKRNVKVLIPDRLITLSAHLTHSFRLLFFLLNFGVCLPICLWPPNVFWRMLTIYWSPWNENSDLHLSNLSSLKTNTSNTVLENSMTTRWHVPVTNYYFTCFTKMTKLGISIVLHRSRLP